MSVGSSLFHLFGSFFVEDFTIVGAEHDFRILKLTHVQEIYQLFFGLRIYHLYLLVIVEHVHLVSFGVEAFNDIDHQYLHMLDK